jgi:hypothetical protein
MRSRIRRLSVTTISAAVLAMGAVGSPVSADARSHIDLDSFLVGLACTESSGRYDALNASTGAYGKYQVMPRIWLSWAGRYLHNRWAPATPANQEFVVRARITDLRALPRTWRQVAHWWLTGNTANESLWSQHSVNYVDEVISVARQAADPSTRDLVPAKCLAVTPATAQVRTTPIPRVNVSGGRVFVRTGAGAEFRSTTTIKRGTVLAVLGHGRDARGKPWLRVGLADGTTGWVAAWYTSPI